MRRSVRSGALDALLATIEREGFLGCFDIRKNPSAVKLSVGGDIAGIKDFLSYPDFVFFSVPSSRKIDDCQYKRVSWISDYARIYTKWRSGAMAECDHPAAAASFLRSDGVRVNP